MNKRLVIVGCSLGVGAFIALGAYTFTSITQQSKAMSELTASIQSLANNQGLSGAELDESVQRSLMAMQDREAAEIRESMFSRYAQASNDWDGDNWLYGSPEARFTLVEYADTECGYCKRFHSTPKGIVEASNGNVNWEYQHLTVMGERSIKQAQAAECVGDQLGNQSFWVYLSEIYERTGSNGQGAGDLRALAQEVGADLTDFDSCVSSGTHIEDIQASTTLARSMGISGTPATVLVDNVTGETQILGGAQPTEAFVQAMRQMMQRDS
ncbi:DsbA family protein [Halomonas sp. KO116]|uniref:DsbA family protein n=1 Tax=Halomonas sp. KO116 TaxID=1504981 RepID=UPI0004E31DC6|nr:thioredoxin domain-containing protein [Halomonas sp. KO116]AJY53261.1 hypothetical protein KO116_P200154 [Halomonas sp. KO116]